MLITGTHDLAIDPKNRLSIPAGVRAKLEAEGRSGSFFLAPGSWRGSLNLYPAEAFEAHVEERHASLEPGEEKDILETVYFAQATPLDVDKQGRVVLPQRMLDEAKIGKRVVLSGRKDHLVLWDRAAFEMFMAEHAPRYKDLLAQARLKTQLVRKSGSGE
jgi:MraZ protein